MTFLEIYNETSGSRAPGKELFISVSYKFGRPEKINDRYEMNLARHRVRGLWKLSRALTFVCMFKL